MKVIDIIKRVGKYLGIEETEKLPSLNDDERTKNICETLLFCLNEVISELSSDYFPQIVEEEYQLNRSKVNFDELNKNILKLYSIKNSRNEYLKFTINSQSASVKTGQRKVFIRYSYMPDIVSSFDADIDFKGRGVTERLIALGVATEYCLYKGKLSEANMFEARYRDAIRSALIPVKSACIKSRVW